MDRRRSLVRDTYHWRMEPVGFAGHEVTYHIKATITPGRGATREEPSEDPEVEIVSVVRYEPPEHHAQDLKPSDWPFTDDEIRVIEDRLLSDL